MTGLLRSHVALIGAGALSLTSCAYLHSILEPLPPGVPAASVRIEGQVARAAGVGIADLMALRQSALAAGSAADDTGSPDAGPQATDALLQAARECMARLESYDLRVWWEEDHYNVWIYPVSQRCFAGTASLHGGGAWYTISPDFKILSKRYDE